MSEEVDARHACTVRGSHVPGGVQLAAELQKGWNSSAWHVRTRSQSCPFWTFCVLLFPFYPCACMRLLRSSDHGQLLWLPLHGS
jgi:hypothetical protein